MMRIFPLIGSLLLVLGIFTGCGGGAVSSTATQDSGADPILPSVPVKSSFEMIDDESFNALSEEDRIYVAKKLYSTLFKGRSLDFFKSQIDDEKFVSDFTSRLSMQTSQPEIDKILVDNSGDLDDERRRGDEIPSKKGKIVREILSRLYFTRLSSDYFSDYIAYVLNQTIMFSPAWEVESVYRFPELIMSNFNRLRDRIEAGVPIRHIVKEHMMSVENWARFRSPEDNGREMLEIWLYNFNDSDVPLAAKVLKNWRFLNHDGFSHSYSFINGIGDEENNETVALLGKELRTGEDFYDAVVNHEDFMYTVVNRVVEYFFPTFGDTEKKEITRQILKNEPTTFKELFFNIILSKKYLYESDRVKSLEETAFSLMHTIEFNAKVKSFIPIDGALTKTNQRTMTYKLGRENSIPVDTLSSSEYHRFIREYILINRDESDVYPDDDGIDFKSLSERYDVSTLDKFVNDIFLDILGRKATENELERLISYFNKTERNSGRLLGDLSQPYSRYEIVMVLLDYFSRLTELYQYRKIEGE